MSVINEALKRAARSATGSQPNGPAVGPLLEPPAEHSPASPQETEGSAPASPRPGRRPINVPRWALALGAILVLALAYARLGTLPEGRSAAAEPAVWRQKIVDDRERLLAEVDELAGEAPASTPEEPEEEAREAGSAEAAAPKRAESPVAASRSPEGRDGAAAVAAAPADDEDEEEEEEEDAEDEEAPPAAASQPGATPAKAPPAAPQQLAGQRPVAAAQRPPVPAPSTPAPGNNTGPTFAKNGVPPYGPLPADRFAYSGPQPRPGAAPAAPSAAAREQEVTDEIFEQAMEREDQGKLEQAGALYALVLEKQPERETASLRLSSLLYGLRRFEEAAEVLRRAIKVGESAVLRNNLGTIYLAQGKLEEARDELSAAAAMDAAYADPHYNLACYYALSGQHQEGLAELMKAKGINPQVIEWAAQDGDLAALRAMPEYQGLTE